MAGLPQKSQKNRQKIAEILGARQKESPHFHVFGTLSDLRPRMGVASLCSHASSGIDEHTCFTTLQLSVIQGQLSGLLKEGWCCPKVLRPGLGAGFLNGDSSITIQASCLTQHVTGLIHQFC